MPRSRRPMAYGPEYEHFLLQFKSQGHITIPLLTPGHALTFRGKLYAYFSALRKAAQRPDLIAIADSLSLTITGRVLSAIPAEDSWDNCALREALGIEKGAVLPPAPPPVATSMPVEPTAQEKLMAKLAEIRQRKGKGAAT